MFAMLFIMVLTRPRSAGGSKSTLNKLLSSPTSLMLFFKSAPAASATLAMGNLVGGTRRTIRHCYGILKRCIDVLVGAGR